VKDYDSFIADKLQLESGAGIPASFLPSQMFDFQSALVRWSLEKGRTAVFADCGLGKTLMQLVWAENVVRHTNSRVLILAPLAVAAQTVREAEKFGIECSRSHRGEMSTRIVVTNYERLQHFNPTDFAGVVCDESSILKSFEGATRADITEFMRRVPYRVLCTATAAPNDFVELGTSSEALGYLGFMDMLTRFFKNDRNNASLNRAWSSGGGGSPTWRFKGHSEKPFWRWVASWSRAIRKPSDLGFADGNFVLPKLIENVHTITPAKPREGMLFSVPAIGLSEEREERRRSLRERCEKAASLVADTGKPAVVWCHLNDEGDALASLIPGAVQVSGKDSDEAKEEKFVAFSDQQIRVLVTKPIIGAWGMNWQHCAHMTSFASHSFEQTYQAIRRMWRFGQKSDVVVDHVLSEGEVAVIANLNRKASQADRMFRELVENMQAEIVRLDVTNYVTKEEVPTWL
jgi:hypothetical protein